ncbi:hypothetical protein FN976_19450 [Caenimonas sedimenti]|uniref:Uncharacterized protein n=1 Tax=Caenimonas sedimenti TaxID=2596921 RepID=A0A562ZMS0_9BURK|nr:hypothetical protein [Caenimonas sedimenti]TWO69464.1 hypothetical protein FN976_19450 [Caenimonas sedimenti]
MKSTVRTQVAVALALLAPLGAAIAAQPAVVIDRGIVHVQATFGGKAIVAPSQSLAIERFVLRQEGRIQPGEEVRYRLIGTPGGRATVDVPGVMRNVVMTESRPGVYLTTYVVRRDDNRDAFANATASLEKNGRRMSAKVDIVNDREFAGGDNRPRDERPPQITDLTPSNGDRVRERGRTEISATVKDEGSGIDRSTVVLRVDGRDVSKRIRFEGDEVRFRDDLRDGRHVAELSVRDRAGNATRTSWSFDVVDRGRGGNGRGDGEGRNR